MIRVDWFVVFTIRNDSYSIHLFIASTRENEDT